MRFLADTHTLVWAVNCPDQLSSAARSVFENEEIIASVASLWELGLKAARNHALVADPLPWWNKYIVRTGVPTLSIRKSDVIALCSLPEIHKDPFDRILVAQCVSEGIPLVTKDALLSRYGVSTVW